MKFSGVTILQGVEFSIFPIDFEWALQQCSATALPVIEHCIEICDARQWPVLAQFAFILIKYNRVETNQSPQDLFIFISSMSYLF